VVGLTDEEVERIACGEAIPKLSVRDLAPAAAVGSDGATTVASTALLASRVGIRVFATGGLGGVHRGARESWDESADLLTLSRTPIGVVCAGVKSILDVGATLERLETLGVTVIGYQTRRFAGFYLADSGFPVDWSVATPKEAADVIKAQLCDSAVVIGNPVAPSDQLDPELHERVLNDALWAAGEQHIHGKAITPFLLLFVAPFVVVVLVSFGTLDDLGRPIFGWHPENYAQVIDPDDNVVDLFADLPSPTA